MKPFTSKQSRAFSRTELCAVLGALAILAATLGSSLARSREPGNRSGCVNNLRQLGMAMAIYSSENNELFAPRSIPRWPARLQRYYGDLSVLLCPNDLANPATFAGPDPADAAPRSYIQNGWSDYYQGFPPTGAALPESAIKYPAATILFGEKVTESGHFWMDYWPGDDVVEVEHARHFRSKASDATSGGSNYAMADGNVRFLKFGGAVAPTNLWFVLDEWRTNSYNASFHLAIPR